MRKFSAILTMFLCILILLFSYASWKEKLASAGRPGETQAVSPVKETEVKSEEKSETVTEPLADLDFERYTASMDEDVQELFINRKESGKIVRMLVIGSDAMLSGNPNYSDLLSKALEESYGAFVDMEFSSFDGTSEEFLASRPNLSAGYDVVLMEPFTLKNNGRVEIETEHLHIQNVFGEILSKTDDAVLVLHPPQPIYGAQFYRTQVRALEEFAELQNYAYINHWEQWPSTEDLTLKDYLTEDSNPNNKGAATWANALIAYFTGS